MAFSILNSSMLFMTTSSCMYSTYTQHRCVHLNSILAIIYLNISSKNKSIPKRKSFRQNALLQTLFSNEKGCSPQTSIIVCPPVCLDPSSILYVLLLSEGRYCMKESLDSSYHSLHTHSLSLQVCGRFCVGTARQREFRNFTFYTHTLYTK